ncbi:MAG: MlaD family protein [Thiohalorhabdus sp.]
MERNVPYLVVGIVVILTGIAFFLFVLWFSQKPGGDEAEHYTIYFRGSVGGLDTGSEVRYQGVAVGRVAGVQVLEDRPRDIRVTIQVGAGTPINRSTVATSSSVGLTGLSYVGLRTEDAGAPPAERVPGEPYPVLESRTSGMDRMLEDLPRVMEGIRSVTARLEKLLGEDTERRVQAILRNSEAFSEKLDRRAEELADLMAQSDSTMESLEATLGETRETLAAGRGLAPEAMALLQRLRAISRRLDRITARHEDSLDRFAGEGLEEVQILLEEGRATLQEIRGLSRRLEEDPSRLLYPPGKQGVEIPR